MQIFSDFSENMKKFIKKIKNGSKQWNFGFWEAGSRKKFLLRVSWSLIFSWFSGEVLEQSDQVVWKPNFWLTTVNNDPKQKNEG